MTSFSRRFASWTCVFVLLLLVGACTSANPNTPGNPTNPVDQPPGTANPVPVPPVQQVVQTSPDGGFTFQFSQVDPPVGSNTTPGFFAGVYANIKNDNSTKVAFCFAKLGENEELPPLSEMRFCRNILQPKTIPGGGEVFPNFQQTNKMFANVGTNPPETILRLRLVGWNDENRMRSGYPPDWANIEIRLNWNAPQLSQTLGLDGPG